MVIEAAAAGLPAVASRIYGLVDAVVDGRTGLLHAPGDVADLTACLRCVAGTAALRHALGSAARDRAARDFSPSILASGLLDLYARLAADSAGSAKNGWYRRFGKRVFDFVGAAAAFVLLLPLGAVVAVVVRLCLGTPFLFWQSRPGLMGVPFAGRFARCRPAGQSEQPCLMPTTWHGRALLRAASLDELAVECADWR